MKVKCSNCDKEIEKTPSAIKRSKSGRHYCSSSCSSTLNNQGTRRNYKIGKASYRHIALKHYGGRCRVCGYENVKALDVHHKDKNRNNNDIENLDVLCPTHHREYHVGIRKYN